MAAIKREFSKRLVPGIYYGHNKGGWLVLIRLGGHGLNLGTGFSGYLSLRPWAWAKYDYADHFSFKTFWRWMKYPEGIKN
jgi:hypothetical protein